MASLIKRTAQKRKNKALTLTLFRRPATIVLNDLNPLLYSFVSFMPYKLASVIALLDKFNELATYKDTIRFT